MENPFPQIKKPELESKIQARIVRKLKKDLWFVKRTHGDRFQSGIPDLYTFHRVYGQRWLEIKRPKGSRLEDTQLDVFGEWEKRKVGVWILSDDDLSPLLQAANWRRYDTGREFTPRVERLASSGKERDLQESLKAKLRADGWHCSDLHGSTFSSGFPDMYICHEKYGSRWTEVKAAISFTNSQRRVFREMTEVGVPIWVLTSDDISPLMKKANISDFADKLLAPKYPLAACKRVGE